MYFYLLNKLLNKNRKELSGSMQLSEHLNQENTDLNCPKCKTRLATGKLPSLKVIFILKQLANVLVSIQTLILNKIIPVYYVYEYPKYIKQNDNRISKYLEEEAADIILDSANNSFISIKDILFNPHKFITGLSCYSS